MVDVKPGKSKRRRLFLIHPDDGLENRVLKSGFWVFFVQIAERLLLTVKVVLLARFLTPEDFGLFGIALILLQILEAFSRTGIRSALIYSRTHSSSELDTAWTLRLIRRSLIGCAVFFLAPVLSDFFKTPGAAPLIKFAALMFIVRALMNISVVTWERDLDFQRISILQAWGTLADVLVSLSLAIVLRSAWALMLGFAAGILVRCAASYILISRRPSLHLSLSAARSLFRYGKWLLGSSVITNISSFIVDVFVGKVLGAAALGYYQVANRISNRPIHELLRVFSRIAFPAYSKIQNRTEKLHFAYFSVLKTTACLSFFFGAGIFCLAPEFIEHVLGVQWMPAIPLIQGLTVASVFKSLAETGTPLFKGAGRPKFELTMQGLGFSVMILSVLPLMKLAGLMGAVLCTLLSAAVAAAVSGTLSRRLISARWRSYIAAIGPPLVSALFMSGFLGLVKSPFFPPGIDLTRAILGFGLLGVAGAVVFGLSLTCFVFVHPSLGLRDELRFFLNLLKRMKMESRSQHFGHSG